MLVRNRRWRSVLFVGAIFGLLTATVSWSLYADTRRQELNQELIIAVKRRAAIGHRSTQEVSTILALLDAGADANAREQLDQSPSLYQRLIDLLHKRPSHIRLGLSPLFAELDPPSLLDDPDPVVVAALLKHGASVSMMNGPSNERRQ